MPFGATALSPTMMPAPVAAPPAMPVPVAVPAIAPLQGPPAPPADPALFVPPAPVAVPVAQPPGPAPIVPTGTPEDIAAANTARQAATLAEGDAKRAASEAEAAEQAAAAERHDAEAEETRQLQERHALAQDEAHRQTEAALKEAHGPTGHVKSFWEGREGKRAEMSFYVALGAAGAALAGGSNQALEIINAATDSYYRREKERVDNLYKFAEQSGKFEDSMRLRHAGELATLQVKFGATKLAIASRIDKQAALSKGRIDQAAAVKMSAQLAEEGNAEIIKAKQALALINLHNAEAARALGKAKAVGRGGGGGAGRGEAYDAFRTAVLAGQTDIGALAARAGLKPAQIPEAVKKIRAEGAGGDDDERSVFDPETGDRIGGAVTKQRAAKTQQDLEALRNVRDDIGALKDHIVRVGAVAPRLPLVGTVTEASSDRETLAKNLITRLSSFKGLGAISKDDRQILEGMISGGWRAAMGLNAAQLDKLTAAVARARDTALKSQGIKTADPAAAPSPEAPKGKRVREKSTGRVGRLVDGKFVPE